eukprot:gene24013-9587_t
MAEEVAEKLEGLEVADEELSLDLGKKKKKKKKGVSFGNDGEEAAEGDQPAGGEAGPAAAPGDALNDDDLGLELSIGKKKKKKGKKARTEFEEDEAEEGADDFGDGVDDAGTKVGNFSWSNEDRDYTYEELLDRVFGILREKNPELTGERRRTVLKPPQVAREGTKKTVFTNFMDLCKAMNRQNEHVSAYLMAELGTSGSLDGSQRLIVKGRFLPKSFETVLRRYVNEYVLCPGCKSVDTLLDKDSATRLMHLRCQQCGASRTVKPITSGFVARVTRRPKT